MSEAEPGGETSTGQSRGRIVLALALLLGLAIAVALIVVGGGNGGDGGDDGASFAAPEECLDAWNEDDDALTKGRHASTFHVYDEVTVGHLTGEDEVTAGGAGPCVVVFARAELDPEVDWAAFEADGKFWSPLSERLDPAALSTLQADAIETANASVIPSGELVSLGG